MRRLLILAPLFAGCYSYTPIAPEAVPTGTEVRARITGAASDRVAPILGTFDTRVLAGNVVENASGALVLEVQTGAVQNTGAAVIPLHQRVPLTPPDIVQLETRRLDVRRTTVLAGAVIAGIATATAVTIHSRGETTGTPGGGTDGPPVTRIPLLRLHF